MPPDKVGQCACCDIMLKIFYVAGSCMLSALTMKAAAFMHTTLFLCLLFFVFVFRETESK